MKQQYIQATSNEAQSRDGLETLIESILFNQSWVVCQNPATTGASMSEPYQHPCLNHIIIHVWTSTAYTWIKYTCAPNKELFSKCGPCDTPSDTLHS